jgi:hypothetical protein
MYRAHMEIEVENSDVAAELARQALPRVVERSANAVMDIGSSALAASFHRFLAEVSEMLDSAPESIGAFAMDEIELSVSIAATGDFRIARSTATGALKVKLRRRAPTAAATEGA